MWVIWIRVQDQGLGYGGVLQRQRQRSQRMQRTLDRVTAAVCRSERRSTPVASPSPAPPVLRPAGEVARAYSVGGTRSVSEMEALAVAPIGSKGLGSKI